MFLPLHARAPARSPALLHHSHVHALPVCSRRLPRNAVLNSLLGLTHDKTLLSVLLLHACVYATQSRHALV